jgi:hypothetical protein
MASGIVASGMTDCQSHDFQFGRMDLFDRPINEGLQI